MYETADVCRTSTNPPSIASYREQYAAAIRGPGLCLAWFRLAYVQWRRGFGVAAREETNHEEYCYGV